MGRSPVSIIFSDDMIFVCEEITNVCEEITKLRAKLRSLLQTAKLILLFLSRRRQNAHYLAAWFPNLSAVLPRGSCV